MAANPPPPYSAPGYPASAFSAPPYSTPGAPYPTQGAPYPTPGAFSYQAGAPGLPEMNYMRPPPPHIFAPSHDQSNLTPNSFEREPFSDKSIRHAFIRKVYLILTTQLLVTCGFIALFLFCQPVRIWVQRNRWFYYVSYAVFLVTYIALACCRSVRRRFPGNFIALSVFTLAFIFMVGTITSYYSTSSVLIAIGITTAVCLALSLFAIQTRIDFTKCSGLIVVASIVLLLTGIACMIVYMVNGPSRVMQAVYGGIGALVFGLYLVFDTQMLIGGRKHELSPEDYIYGALELYLDVVNMFLMLLALVGTRD